LDVAIIVVSLLLLMVLSYRGYSIIVLAPIFALLAAATSEWSLMPLYSELFMTKMAEYIKMYFPVILLGAIFGKVMEEGGLATVIADAIVAKMGKKNAIMAVVLAAAALTYGGVSGFVIVFAVYSFAKALFRKADIPKRLMPAAIFMGTFSFATGSMPGSPQIQNIVPTVFYGTTTWAGPVNGLLGSAIIFVLGMAWFAFRRRQALKSGEGYGDHADQVKGEQDPRYLPPLYLAVLPLVAVVVLNFYLSNPFDWQWGYFWKSELLDSLKPLQISLLATDVQRVKTLWSLNAALVVGIVLAIGIGFERIRYNGSLTKPINEGTTGSIQAILNTAAGFGYGSVVAKLAGFKVIKDIMMSITLGPGPLFSEAVAVNVMAGVAGSGASGITIALGMLAQDYLEWAQTAHVPVEIVHRIACMSAGGLDTLPHNGGAITFLMVCGLTHKEAYLDFVALTLIKTVVPFICIVIYAYTGWV